TVSLYLPATGSANRAAAGGEPGEGETVLLVEDEEAVRVVIGALLRRHGYQVLEAPTPHQALEIFVQHAQAIDLLLTDVVMPGMNGPALAQRCVAENPRLRVLFISGYGDVTRPAALAGPH